jgi:hypothetical protein
VGSARSSSTTGSVREMRAAGSLMPCFDEAPVRSNGPEATGGTSPLDLEKGDAAGMRDGQWCGA